MPRNRRAREHAAVVEDHRLDRSHRRSRVSALTAARAAGVLGRDEREREGAVGGARTRGRAPRRASTSTVTPTRAAPPAPVRPSSSTASTGTPRRRRLRSPPEPELRRSDRRSGRTSHRAVGGEHVDGGSRRAAGARRRRRGARRGCPAGARRRRPSRRRGARLRSVTTAPRRTGTATTRPTAPLGRGRARPAGSSERWTATGADVAAVTVGRPGGRGAATTVPGLRARRRRPGGAATRGRRRRRSPVPTATTTAAPQSSRARGERRSMGSPFQEPARGRARSGVGEATGEGEGERWGAARRSCSSSSGDLESDFFDSDFFEPDSDEPDSDEPDPSPEELEDLESEPASDLELEPSDGLAWTVRRRGCRSCRSRSPSARCRPGRTPWRACRRTRRRGASSGSSLKDW